MPSVLTLLLHLGSLVGDARDVEGLVADLFAKKSVGADITKVLGDLAALFANGVLPLPPGLTASEVAAAFTSLLSAL
jgi:hypothetical protein